MDNDVLYNFTNITSQVIRNNGVTPSNKIWAHHASEMPT